MWNMIVTRILFLNQSEQSSFGQLKDITEYTVHLKHWRTTAML